MHVIPGSPFAGETSKLPAKVKERLYEKYGLDKPVSEQYVMYLKNAAKGDFGVSIYRKGKSIDKIIKNGLPYTMRLGAVSITFACLKTSIGLVTSCSEAFEKMFPGRFPTKPGLLFLHYFPLLDPTWGFPLSSILCTGPDADLLRLLP